MVSFGSIVKNEGYGILLCNPFVHSIHYLHSINIFCDKYDSSQGTYCKRLKVLCPEHTKEPKVRSKLVFILYRSLISLSLSLSLSPRLHHMRFVGVHWNPVSRGRRECVQFSVIH